MEIIDTSKIRGIWEELSEGGMGTAPTVSGGDDTIKSIEIVAEKVNEIVEWINSKKDQLIN